MRPFVFAHRGASAYAPENTMAAFEKALEIGVDGIELDVQLTKEGEIIICHDETLDRTTDRKGFIHSHTYEEIKTFDAGSWFGPSFKGERIPTLEMLFDRVKSLDIILNVELKNSIVQYEGLEEKVIGLTSKYGMEERVIISSFNHYSLVKVHQLAPTIETGVLYMEGLYKPWEYAARIGAKALHPYFRACVKEIVYQSAEAGIKTRPFTVDDPVHLRKMMDDGVDSIITNVPDRLKKLFDEMGM